MADISDVTALLATMTAAAVYPNGTSAPSVTGNPITVFEGWPLQQSLDAAILAGQSQVSVFPKLGGAPGSVFQILNEDYLVVPPVHGMTITSVSDGVVTVMGSPSPGEYLTIIADGRNVFSQTGPDLPTILNLIAAQAAPIYGDLSVFQTSGSGPQLLLTQATGGGIEFPTVKLQARLGAPATKGRATHRQRPTIMISIWSPNNADRNTIAIAVDVALKQVNRLTFPDTSEGQLFAAGFAQIDALEPSSVFRRDLFFTCEYATLQLFQAFEVTSFNLTIGSIVGGGEVDQTFAD